MKRHELKVVKRELPKNIKQADLIEYMELQALLRAKADWIRDALNNSVPVEPGAHTVSIDGLFRLIVY